MISINARSVPKNFEKIEMMCYDLKPSIVFCTEARVTKKLYDDKIACGENDPFEIENYVAIFCYSQSRATGGVIAYIKKQHKYKVILNNHVNNVIWYLSIEILDCAICGIFTAVYRSPSFNLNDTIDTIDWIFENTIEFNKLNIIVGDMNIDFQANVSETNLMKFMINKYSLSMIIDFNTRITNRSETMIDHVYTNDIDRVKCEMVLNHRISDHETIKIAIERNANKEQTKQQVISWKNYSKYQLISNLRKCDWSKFHYVDIENKLKILRDNLLQAVLPMVRFVSINPNEKPKKWYDNELKHLKQSKLDAYNDFANYKCDTLWAKYVAIRNSYNKLIKIKKNDYIKLQIRDSGNNQRQMWQYLRKLLPNKSTPISDEIVFDNESFTDEKQICERFNKYFVDSIVDINRNIPPTNEQSEQFNTNNHTKLVFEHVNVDEVINVMKSLSVKVNKSQLCNSMVWFDSIEYCANFMAKIVNESLDTGEFPDDWKIATVTPIPKVQNTKNANEYRAINSMPVDEKMIEAVVKNQLVKYIESNKIISKHQSGFRTNHSCETSINYLINDWKKSMENGEKVVVLSLDLKRAFETIDRNRMLLKLQSIGVTDKELKWFTNYLKARRQQTKYKYEMSNECDVPIGLPQGTSLSVVLFIIYIDNITKLDLNGSVVLFADDTMIIVKDKDVNNAIVKLNQDLVKVENWLNENLLSLNKKKTNMMILSRTSIETDIIECKMGNDVIERVNQIKYLGILIDDKLCFDKQINECIKKVASKTNVLYRISRSLTFDTKKIVYNTIILPHFQYCSTVYFTCNKEQIAQLQKLQNRAMRLILKCDFLTPREFMLRALNWLSIIQMIKFNVLVFIYKMLNDMLPNYLCENLILTNAIHDRNTRQSNNNLIRLPDYKLEFTRKNIFYQGSKLYNELPNEIKVKPSLNAFKVACRKFIIDTYEIV